MIKVLLQLVIKLVKFLRGVDGGCIAIGLQAGQFNQCNYSIAIGIGAGQHDQAQSTDGSIAIGIGAGSTGQGGWAVAIGHGAGALNQHSNTIILNGSPSDLNSTHDNSFYVAPIAGVNDSFRVLMYDTVHSEIVYSDTSPQKHL